MNITRFTALTFVLLASVLAATGAKTRSLVPAFVRRAHTVAVVVDPDAGVSLDDPRANQVAQKDVETALMNWGRYEVILSREHADIIVVVRKGNKHPVQQTISDPRQNGRAGVINPTDDGIGIGAQHGPQPPLSGGAPAPRWGTGDAHPTTEIASTDDSFAVYEGKVDKPLDAAPAWRFNAKDALKPHSVPAVEEFRKAVAEADTAAARKP